MIVSGDKKLFTKKILTKGEMGRGGSMKGPKYPRVADRLVKRMIRGMLPWDRMKGREAFRQLKCYIGNGSVEESLVAGAIKFDHKMPMKYSTIKEIVEILK
jgi:large subunit ribosomal protein L13